MATTVSRINITLPKELISELRGSIPKRERSRIIAKALGEEIAKMKSVKKIIVKLLLIYSTILKKRLRKTDKSIIELTTKKYIGAENLHKLPIINVL